MEQHIIGEDTKKYLLNSSRSKKKKCKTICKEKYLKIIIFLGSLNFKLLIVNENEKK